MEKNTFFILRNDNIARNLYKHRKIKGIKAFEVAKYIGITESAYTKYERGETKITIEIIQKVSECLGIDPLQIIVIDNEMAMSIYGAGNKNLSNEIPTHFMESIILLNQRVVQLLERIIPK